MGAQILPAWADEAEWQTITCPRVGAPPLRFVGRCLDVSALPLSGPVMHMALYQRRKGGFTATTAHLTEEGWRPDAVTGTTLDDVMTTIETHCATPPKARASFEGAHAAELVKHLGHHLRREGEWRSYLTHVGRVLDRWHSQTSPPPQTSPCPMTDHHRKDAP